MSIHQQLARSTYWLINLTLLLLLMNLIRLKPAQAQAKIDLGIQPASAFLHVKPGEKLQHTISLANKSNQALEFTMSIVDFKADGLTGQPILKRRSSFYDQVSLNPDLSKPFVLQAGENKTISLGLQIAKTAPEKEYHLTFLFKAQPVNNRFWQLNGSGSQIGGIIGSNLILYLSPTGEDKSAIDIAQIETNHVIDSLAPLRFSILAENTGKNSQVVQAKAKLFNWLDQQVNEYFFYPDVILAQSTRLLRGLPASPAITDPQEITWTNYQDQLSTQLQYRPLFLLGRYRLQITVNQQTQQVEIWALPFSLIGVVLLGLMIAGGLRYYQNRTL
ncbi:MAG: hypothetical protein GF390_02100 [Candidatus Pacebacteria bacterium]|nr:hypothetical protein [Candidatus Paceibacterota bacterium]